MLEKLSEGFSFPQQVAAPRQAAKQDQPEQKKIIILTEKELTSNWLHAYLDERKIRPAIAQQYCREITYSYGDRSYYGIGFKNISSGFEIRRKYAKLSSSPKDITLIKNGSDKLAIFEGFTDFLSFLSLDRKTAAKGTDFLILNSTSFFEKSIDLMNSYQTKWLYLDNDATGHKCRDKVLSLKAGYEDRSILYEGHKDLNEWLVNKDRPHRQQMRRGL
ncbi:toprim domain-containing protein [Pedobacter duraquae]|uniref:toprim domain-containing protein n=1 Tax=Pedobacter duraquae TaxID=425511 RepID=UPI00105C2BEE|nr:toprim domain-containing protein [Pedobacter duraquae]